MAAKPEFTSLKVSGDLITRSPEPQITVEGPAPDGDDTVCIFWHVDQGGKVVGGVTKPKEVGKEMRFVDTKAMHPAWRPWQPAVVVGIEVRVVLEGPSAGTISSYMWSRQMAFTTG